MIAVGVGANIDPLHHIPAGLARLHARAPVVRRSPFWWTAPLGRPEQAPYLNGVVELETPLGPRELIGVLRDVEAATGRVRTEDAYAPRTLDLDLLLHHDEVDPELGLPDPDIHRRPWLARGLLALRPGLVLPGEDAPLPEPEDAGMVPEPALGPGRTPHQPGAG